MTTVAEKTGQDSLTELLAAVAALAPKVEAQRDRIFAERKLPETLVSEMAAAGFFRMLTPRALGGLEIGPWEAAEVVEALSRIDGSVGWSSMIGSQNGWFTAFLPARGASAIASLPLAGALKPGGKANRTDGGFSVSGRWSMASGSSYAGWLYGSCLVEPPQGRDPEVRVVYLPVQEVRILDTWQTAGLRGTASNDFVAQDVFVPEEHTFTWPNFPLPAHVGPLYRCRIQNLIFVLQGAQALGVAAASFDAFAAMAATKTRWASSAVLRDEGSVRREVATAEAMTAGARSLLREVTAETWATVLGGDTPSLEQRRQLRLAITHAILSSQQAVATLHALAGAAAVYESSPLQRHFQDITAAGAHVQASPAFLELCGGLRLGSEEAVSSASL